VSFYSQGGTHMSWPMCGRLFVERRADDGPHGSGDCLQRNRSVVIVRPGILSERRTTRSSQFRPGINVMQWVSR